MDPETGEDVPPPQVWVGAHLQALVVLSSGLAEPDFCLPDQRPLKPPEGVLEGFAFSPMGRKNFLWVEKEGPRL